MSKAETIAAAREEYLAALPDRIQEQLHWADGLRMADPCWRKNERDNVRSELLAAGGEHVAFWRGLVEGSGTLWVERNVNVTWDRPVVLFSGSRIFCWTILEWLYEHFPGWDPANRLIKQYSRRSVRAQNSEAQGLVEILWPSEDCYCYPLNRDRAAAIKGWIPKSGSEYFKHRVSDLIDTAGLDGFKKQKKRPEYHHLFNGEQA